VWRDLDLLKLLCVFVLTREIQRAGAKGLAVFFGGGGAVRSAMLLCSTNTQTHTTQACTPSTGLSLEHRHKLTSLVPPPPLLLLLLCPTSCPPPPDALAA
jgi:hypothetical protein